MDTPNGDNGDYTMVRGSRGSLLFVHHGFVFVKDQTHHGVIFIRCMKRFCHARGRINLNDNSSFFSDDGLHTHGPSLPQ